VNDPTNQSYTILLRRNEHKLNVDGSGRLLDLYMFGLNI